MKINSKKIIAVLMSGILLLSGSIKSESIDEIDRRAQKYYEQRELNKAISEWLLILDIDPNNEEIQKKIERVYDEKHKKDLAAQKAKIYMKLSKKKLKTNFESSKADAEKAMKNFITAYRINPNDPELQVMKEQMRSLDKEIKVEDARIRLSRELKKKLLQRLC